MSPGSGVQFCTLDLSTLIPQVHAPPRNPPWIPHQVRDDIAERRAEPE